ncbi:PqqD family protein [Leadbetterella byssophila]|uniref:PqqD family protein n=1 Tax=Leadbetterella byssophila (strain DSM 17132 / JCM 16389 / KACC 11308 / NBRC 106382 / 4M15) TaxID=649349 RepID=E4RV15_LEAB4|nr:PqqD family protein [Leadbetterella byssophila]ADQ17895.1 hypothetical protein Lbys_2203 [Leadbetterella byssophila DSM 17132]
MKYIINTKKVIFTQLGEEGVLMDVEKNEYQSMNETYFRIFQMVSEGEDSEDIIHALREEYQVEEQVCRAEVERVIQELLKKEYIR